MNLAVRSLFIVIGTITLGFVFYKTIGPVGHWYESRFAQNDSDLGQIFMAALAVQLLSLVAGGWLGDWAFRKWQQRRLDRQKLK